MYNESILFMSAFGEPVNIAYSGTAINDKFKEIYGTSNIAIAPWTSATPLSGELLQTSLDALLQNDLNLLSASSDAYFRSTNNGASTNVQKILYSPIGGAQTVISGSFGNSLNLSAVVGTLAGQSSGINFGSTVPSTPFVQGSTWNYGLFGVKNGAPTWYDVNIEDISKSVDGKSIFTHIHGPYIADSTVSFFDQAGGYFTTDTTNIYSATSKAIAASPEYFGILSGSWNPGDVIEYNIILNDILMFASNGTSDCYPNLDKSFTDCKINLCSAGNGKIEPQTGTDYFTNLTLFGDSVNTDRTEYSKHYISVQGKTIVNKACTGIVGFKPGVIGKNSLWTIGTTYDENSRRSSADSTVYINYRKNTANVSAEGMYLLK